MNHTRLTIAAAGLLTLGVVARLWPHWPNATPLTALALVGSLYLGKRFGLGLPLLALFLSDLMIGFYDWRIMTSVYLSFALIGILNWLGHRSRQPLILTLTLIGSSGLFFIITNAAVWLFSSWYEKSWAGLWYAYELGLPFWRNMMLGDILYAVALVGAIEAARYGLQRASHSASWRTKSPALLAGSAIISSTTRSNRID